MLSDKLQREAFHFLFLERLLKISDPKLYVLKGGVNFRFFFKSHRYSEDMDLDCIGGAVETLRKNGYKILDDPSFVRSLKVYGIESLILGDKNKAKHTATTQRFSLRLVNGAGEEFPTKIEFSRRSAAIPDSFAMEIIQPTIAAQFNRLSFPCQHYLPASAVLQKIRALAGRSETQARDVFDLYVLYLKGALTSALCRAIEKKDREKALLAMASLDYDAYRGQVLEYLEPAAHQQFSSRQTWDLMTQVITECLHE
jgi:predicted nucleotidyltransferase component of viral defense system